MHVVVKTHCPDWFENGDHALIELSEHLILQLDKRIAQAKRSYEPNFYGIKWWDYTPDWLTLTPEEAGVDEEEYEQALEANYFVPLPESFDPADMEFSRMGTVVLTVCCSSDDRGSFYWAATEKHSGARVEAYELSESVLDDWAELIGCTEKLKDQRSKHIMAEWMNRGGRHA